MTNGVQLTASQIAALRGWLATHPCIVEAFVFGSRARGTARPDSDIDLAVFLDMSDAEPPMMGSCRGLYEAQGDAWQAELSEIVGLRVRIVAPSGPEYDPVWFQPALSREGVKVWPA